MSDDQGTGFEWRRKRGWINRTVEKVEDLTYNVVSRGRPLTELTVAYLEVDGHSVAVDWPATSGGRFS